MYALFFTTLRSQDTRDLSYHIYMLLISPVSINKTAGKDWRQEEKGTTEDEMVGWHHQLDEHESKKAPGFGDGQGRLVCCSPWGCKESDTTEQLNWTEHVHMSTPTSLTIPSSHPSPGHHPFIFCEFVSTTCPLAKRVAKSQTLLSNWSSQYISIKQEF